MICICHINSVINCDVSKPRIRSWFETSSRSSFCQLVQKYLKCVNQEDEKILHFWTNSFNKRNVLTIFWKQAWHKRKLFGVICIIIGRRTTRSANIILIYKQNFDNNLLWNCCALILIILKNINKCYRLTINKMS